jgi:hypothetical protein
VLDGHSAPVADNPSQADEAMAVFAAAAEGRDPRTGNLYFDVAPIVTDESTPGDAALVALRVRTRKQALRDTPAGSSRTRHYRAKPYVAAVIRPRQNCHRPSGRIHSTSPSTGIIMPSMRR